ncbi:unnamed protein product, partial [Gordionus sp. m RMFG-2023]
HQQHYRNRHYISKILNVDDANHFMNQLNHDERNYIKEYFDLIEQTKNEECSPPTYNQLRIVFIYNALPFVGFGIIDNLILITAGEYIDMKLGAMLGISTMAAAALGNIISDIVGIGLAHYIEILAGSFGVPTPDLNFKQQNMKSAKLFKNLGRTLGIAFGCFIGMFPLLFYPDKKKEITISTTNDLKDKSYT